MDLEHSKSETYSNDQGNEYLLQIEYNNLEVVFEEVDQVLQENNTLSYVKDSTYTPADLYYRGYQD